MIVPYPRSSRNGCASAKVIRASLFLGAVAVRDLNSILFNCYATLLTETCNDARTRAGLDSHAEAVTASWQQHSVT